MIIDIEVRDGEAQRLLARLAGRLDNGRPQLLGLIDRLLAAERERFAGRGARWRKLAASTVRKDTLEHRDPRPMILTGQLMRSLTLPGAPGQRVTVRPHELRFGTRVFYAKFHQKGKGVPRRTIVGLTRIQRAGVVDELRRLLIEDL